MIIPLRRRLAPLVAGVALACTGGSRADLPSAIVAQGPFDVTLSVPGELEAKRQTTIEAPDLDVSIKVNWIVEDGVRVAEGDVLVEIDRVELEKRLEQARDSLVIAETKIVQARSQLAVKVADGEADVVRAQLALKRAQMHVTDSETVPLVEREGARLDVIEQEMAIERARSALVSTKLEGDAELQLLTLEATQARRQVDDVEEQLGKTTVRAPSPGLVIRAKVWKGGSHGLVEAGDSVWSGSMLLSLPDLTEMQVIAWVHEVDSARVAVDQAVKVVLDAHPDSSYTGNVEKVADLAVSRGKEAAAKHLKITVALAETAPQMKPGMSVRTELMLQHLDEALSVPIEAVTHRGDEAWVRVAGRFGGWDERAIQLGPENDTHVVVTEGLEAGTTVALVDPAAWAKGELPGAAETEGGKGATKAPADGAAAAP